MKVRKCQYRCVDQRLFKCFKVSVLILDEWFKIDQLVFIEEFIKRRCDAREVLHEAPIEIAQSKERSNLRFRAGLTKSKHGFHSIFRH